MQLRFPLQPYPESKKGLPLSSGRLRFLSRKSGAIFKWLRSHWGGSWLLPGTIQMIPAQIIKAGSGKSWTSAEPDGVHAKEAGRSYWQRGVKTYHYMQLNWFFLLFSCQFAVSFFWPLSFICADCNSSHCLRLHMILTIWSYVTFGHEKTALLLSWQREALHCKKANENQRCDSNFPLPLLENPIRGSEQK